MVRGQATSDGEAVSDAEPFTAEEIRERLSKITPGPWTMDEHFPESRGVLWGFEANGTCGDIQLADVQELPKWAKGTLLANADFIAHAPEDIAALLATLDASQARVAELTAENKWLREVEKPARLILRWGPGALRNDTERHFFDLSSALDDLDSFDDGEDPDGE